MSICADLETKLEQGREIGPGPCGLGGFGVAYSGSAAWAATGVGRGGGW